MLTLGTLIFVTTVFIVCLFSILRLIYPKNYIFTYFRNKLLKILKFKLFLLILLIILEESKAQAIGIGSFDPIDINPNSKTYGYITDTPKENWAHYDFLGTMKKNFHIPFA